MKTIINQKLKKIINNNKFTLCLIIFINFVFFILINILFKIKYETIDDFTITNIISKLDGTYSYYSIYIHPLISYLIMILYKTNININFYTYFLLIMQFISFTVIGVILVNKNKKLGVILYILIISIIYSRILIKLNYSNVAAIMIVSGTISIINYIDTRNTKYKIISLLLILLGTMLRWKSIIIVMPFYIIYIIFYTIQNKNKIALKMLIYIFVIVLSVYISNYIIYKVNPIYKQHAKFNNIRTYFFDSNIVDYNENKEIFDKMGWTHIDYDMLYTYSLNNEKVYTLENLEILKNNLNININFYINKVITSFRLLYIYTTKIYLFLFIITLLLLIISLITKKNRAIIVCFFIINILMNYALIYSKPVFRVIISAYATSIIIMIYTLLSNNKFTKKQKLIIELLAIYIIILNAVILSANSILYKNYNNISYIRSILKYTNEHKENAYIYSTSLHQYILEDSVYNKINDEVFCNLRSMSDWDIYNNEYYEFKERYDIKNIIEDLYKKNNLYIITSDNVSRINNKLYVGHINLIKKYIKEKYNVNTEEQVIQNFDNKIKIYKLYKINE